MDDRAGSDVVADGVRGAVDVGGGGVLDGGVVEVAGADVGGVELGAVALDGGFDAVLDGTSDGARDDGR